ncbi:hypothetical protein B5F78_13220 [Bacteroides sp. An279]|nr:hypothetical protein B5F78_13220 [Bacteroides sp. An279]
MIIFFLELFLNLSCADLEWAFEAFPLVQSKYICIFCRHASCLQVALPVCLWRGISRYRAGRFGERGGYLAVLGGYLFPVAAFFG